MTSDLCHHNDTISNENLTFASVEYSIDLKQSPPENVVQIQTFSREI